eukprot:363931-Chlamydomonas_euryale.AAC.6
MQNGTWVQNVYKPARALHCIAGASHVSGNAQALKKRKISRMWSRDDAAACASSCEFTVAFEVAIGQLSLCSSGGPSFPPSPKQQQSACPPSLPIGMYNLGQFFWSSNKAPVRL